MSVARGGGVERYAEAASFLNAAEAGAGTAAAIGSLVDRLREWAKPLPRLREYGYTREDLPGVAAASGNKNQPYAFEAAEIEEMLLRVFE